MWLGVGLWDYSGPGPDSYFPDGETKALGRKGLAESLDRLVTGRV